MGAVARNAYLHSRVSMMAARLLPDHKLRSLIELGPEQESTIFNAAGLVGLPPDEPTVPPHSLEQRLVTALLADFVILVRALSGPERDFLIYWAYRFELSNLKTILRGKMTGQSAGIIHDQLLGMGPFATLPVGDLLHTEDVAELLRRLERTPFADIARQARLVFEEHHDLFALDAAVDRRYFVGLNKHARKIKGREARLVRALLGIIIDRINLLWLLRYRFSYDLPPAEAYYLLIPAGDCLKSHHLLALSRMGTFEEVIQHLPKPFARLLATL
jgi:V/A-type H+-transporting ATPase subunit C